MMKFFIGFFLILFVHTSCGPGGSCDCPDKNSLGIGGLLMLAVVQMPYDQFVGSCDVPSKSFCIDYAPYYHISKERTLCKVRSGTFRESALCARGSLVGKCTVNVEFSQQKLEILYYSSAPLGWNFNSAKSDCESARFGVFQ
ncbi:hypothetical protein EHQ12_12400 [Leptospira gomenensis]|uniref:Uncharacterized protein n=2 Tax=Leptospira gomenensis TaxID=2484974 RepID=A0A5F1YPD4_9LEPT|nr:hypothetical protein [Leptospira gomenensis]TGK32734.1 hypothetical protein EHQ17_12245 [Leptospira gomenensis]TGK36881.1 hypothetical protein EHQ12_12400 [Leptospira gomenensis]TGK44353.1 hypothetical protein EHQ07_11715 [Leptospira gomenensis]TGK58846.1 hypothetical protein EHQ13_13535 [Leptospira gomenensis]